MTSVDGSFDEKVEEVEAFVDTGGLSPGRHTFFVRGRDANGNWGPFSAVFCKLASPFRVYLMKVARGSRSGEGGQRAAEMHRDLFLGGQDPVE
jgi:hypothetical protein